MTVVQITAPVGFPQFDHIIVETKDKDIIEMLQSAKYTVEITGDWWQLRPIGSVLGIFGTSIIAASLGIQYKNNRRIDGTPLNDFSKSSFKTERTDKAIAKANAKKVKNDE